jgi:hypothetical protein
MEVDTSGEEGNNSGEGVDTSGKQEESTNSVKDVSKFSFGSSVLLRGAWA